MGSQALLYPGLLEGFFPTMDPTPTTCNEDGLFQHLWLDQNNLDGKLPEELYMLTFLRSLSFGANRLQGTISSLVGQLTALEGLVIKKLENAGRIPTEMGLLTNLRALVLDNNDHQGYFPTELWQLTNLETIYLGRNPKLKGMIPYQINTTSNLRWLGIGFNGFSGELLILWYFSCCWLRFQSLN